MKVLGKYKKRKKYKKFVNPDYEAMKEKIEAEGIEYKKDEYLEKVDKKYLKKLGFLRLIK